jgi:hypothetical protein
MTSLRGWSDKEMEAGGFDPKRDRFVWEIGPDGKQRRKQVQVWLKPSEQLAIKMLESWHKRYRRLRRPLGAMMTLRTERDLTHGRVTGGGLATSLSNFLVQARSRDMVA